MNISEVHMVRSAKDNDMLCVDNYLYYYDDRGLTTYRWSCNKRKDKVVPCRSRIITKLVDGDEANHTVIKVFGAHSHEKCSPEEISKAFARKRLANLEGKPCTLEAKAEKRKRLRMVDDMDEEKDVKKVKTIKIESDDSMSNDEENSYGDDDVGSDSHDSTSNQRADTEITNSIDTLPTISKRDNIYMLKTSHGRDMVCVDGYLYRLEGISFASSIFRWECSRRRDDGCKARIQTTRIHDRKHTLKQRRFHHNHAPYAQDKLLKLFTRSINRPSTEISLAKIPKESTIVRDVAEFEKIDIENGEEFLKDIINPTDASNFVQSDLITEAKEYIDISETQLETITYSPEVVDDIIEEADEEEKYEPKKLLRNSVYNTEDPLVQREMDLSQLYLLPSGKGHNMLCIDNFVYHFEAKSTKKPLIYWTCVRRRNKMYNCRARITTNQNFENGLKIINASGRHTHSRDIEKIRKRLCNELVSRAVTDGIDMKPTEFLNKEIPKLNNNLKAIIANSIDIMCRKISKMRNKICRNNSKGELNRGKSESISSLSSAWYSDDEDLPVLPTKLEHMKANKKDVPMKAIKPTVFGTNYDAIKKSVHDYESKIKMNYVDNEGKFFYSEEDNKCKESSSDESEYEYQYEEIISDMDLTKVTTLRSAKGGELLCIDNYIYHVKSTRDSTTYWECIKSKNKILRCKSRVITIQSPKGHVVRKVTNQHSHNASIADIEIRILKNAKNAAKLSSPTPCNIDDFKRSIVRIPMRKDNSETRSVMKLYSVSDGPPSLAVRMTLKALKVPYELVNIDFAAGEHMTEEYAKMNPQKEIPVLDDDGFYLSESIAIMQYLCDKYAPHSSLYPKEPSKRALVNQRLCFNSGFYYSSISAHVMAPIFFDYQRTQMSLKKVKNALEVFETYLKRSGTKYAAANKITIADFALIAATLCLEAIGFDLTPYPLIKKWYGTFKLEYVSIWEIANKGMKEIEEFEKNPPDLSNLNHPFHPTRKSKPIIT